MGEKFQRTPTLAAMLHEIQYDANNHGVADEDLDAFAYLRTFEIMGEELAVYDDARRAHKAFNSDRRQRLKEFGIEGFYAVVEVAKQVSGISSEELTPPTHEEQRRGLYMYTSLAPYIGILEKDPQKPTGKDRQALKNYLSVLQQKLPTYKTLAPLPQRK